MDLEVCLWLLLQPVPAHKKLASTKCRKWILQAFSAILGQLTLAVYAMTFGGVLKWTAKTSSDWLVGRFAGKCAPQPCLEIEIGFALAIPSHGYLKVLERPVLKATKWNQSVSKLKIGVPFNPIQYFMD
jgi:hypothetical protein